MRTLHFMKDNERAVQEAELLEKGDFNGFLRVIKESGNSSWMYLAKRNRFGKQQESGSSVCFGNVRYSS